MTTNIEETIRLVAQRQLGSAVLLFLSGHRPLAFAGGQFLHMLTPMAALIGFDGCADWARLLSDEDCLDQLERALSSDGSVTEKTGLVAKSCTVVATSATSTTQNPTADHVA